MGGMIQMIGGKNLRNGIKKQKKIGIIHPGMVGMHGWKEVKVKKKHGMIIGMIIKIGKKIMLMVILVLVQDNYIIHVNVIRIIIMKKVIEGVLETEKEVE